MPIDIRESIDDTWFSWMSGIGEDAVFYYRVHSLAILIEFDHRRGIALKTEGVARDHVNTVVRTVTTTAGACCASTMDVTNTEIIRSIR